VSSGDVQKTVLHQVVNCTSAGAVYFELSESGGLKLQFLMISSNKLQSNVGVGRNGESVSLSIVIDHCENHSVATLNGNNWPSSVLRPASIVACQVYNNSEGANCSGHAGTRSRRRAENHSENSSSGKRCGNERNYDNLTGPQQLHQRSRSDATKRPKESTGHANRAIVNMFHMVGVVLERTAEDALQLEGLRDQF
jgi:hypothetical protein